MWNLILNRVLFLLFFSFLCMDNDILPQEKTENVCLGTTSLPFPSHTKERCSKSIPTILLKLSDIVKGKGKILYGQEPPSGESTTTECGVNYQLLVVMY